MEENNKMGGEINKNENRKTAENINKTIAVTKKKSIKLTNN